MGAMSGPPCRQRSAPAPPGRTERWGYGGHVGAPMSIEERPGSAGALRTLGVWGPCRGPHVDRRAPRLRRGVPQVGGCGGPFEAPHVLGLILIHPRARARRRRPGGEAIEELAGCVGEEQQPEVLAAHEALAGGVRQPAQEPVVVTLHVQRPDRLGVNAELRPRQYLERLLERSETAGQR